MPGFAAAAAVGPEQVAADGVGVGLHDAEQEAAEDRVGEGSDLDYIAWGNFRVVGQGVGLGRAGGAKLREKLGRTAEDAKLRGLEPDGVHRSCDRLAHGFSAGGRWCSWHRLDAGDGCGDQIARVFGVGWLLRLLRWGCAWRDDSQLGAAVLQDGGLYAVHALEGDGYEPGVAVAGLLALGHQVIEHAGEPRPLRDGEKLSDNPVVGWVGTRIAAELDHDAVKPAAGGHQLAGVAVFRLRPEDSIDYIGSDRIDIDGGGAGRKCRVFGGGCLCKRYRVCLEKVRGVSFGVSAFGGRCTSWRDTGEGGCTSWRDTQFCRWRGENGGGEAVEQVGGRAGGIAGADGEERARGEGCDCTTDGGMRLL